MLHTLTALERMSIRASDGDIGMVKDTYFDDLAWTLRYLVIDTGRWLPGRKVLISPLSVTSVDWQERTVAVDLTRNQIKGSPGIDLDQPVSRQRETAYFDYFGYPYYWAGPLRWGPVAFPPNPGIAQDHWLDYERRTPARQADPHLRSTEAVTGYHIEAADGPLGHVQDFLYDEQDWSLRFLAADTRNWLPGRHVLVAIDRVERVSWGERKVHVNLTQDSIRRAPEWRPELALLAQDEDFLHSRGAIIGSDRTRDGQVR